MLWGVAQSGRSFSGSRQGTVATVSYKMTQSKPLPVCRGMDTVSFQALLLALQHKSQFDISPFTADTLDLAAGRKAVNTDAPPNVSRCVSHECGCLRGNRYHCLGQA